MRSSVLAMRPSPFLIKCRRFVGGLTVRAAIAFLFLIRLVLPASIAHAEKRVALVIGMLRYPSAPAAVACQHKSGSSSHCAGNQRPEFMVAARVGG